MTRSAQYEIVLLSERVVLIRDIGPWDMHLSVTNDAESVVSRVWEETNRDSLCQPLANARYFCIDTEGDIDELVHELGTFKGFDYAELSGVVGLLEGTIGTHMAAAKKGPQRL